MGKEAVLPFTKLVNLLLAKPALALLALLHIQSENAQYPIPNYLAMEILLFIVLAIFFLWLRARISTGSAPPERRGWLAASRSFPLSCAARWR